MPRGDPAYLTAPAARPVVARILAHVVAGGVVLGESVGVHGALSALKAEPSPLSEAATVALATGMALAGKRVVVEVVDPHGLRRAGDALADLAGLAGRSAGAFAPTVIVRAPGGTDVRGVDVPVYVSGREADAADQLDQALAHGGVCVLVDDCGPDAPVAGEGAALGDPVRLRDGDAVAVFASGCDLAAALAGAEKAAADGVEAGVVEVRGNGSLAAEAGRAGRLVFVGDGPWISALAAVFWKLETPWTTLPRGATATEISNAITLVAGD